MSTDDHIDTFVLQEFRLRARKSGRRGPDRSDFCRRHYGPRITERSDSPPSSTDWTHAGLLTLVGSDGDELAMRPDPSVWPLPLSRPLGVRIYESRR